jgi:hypothetical protein
VLATGKDVAVLLAVENRPSIKNAGVGYHLPAWCEAESKAAKWVVIPLNMLVIILHGLLRHHYLLLLTPVCPGVNKDSVDKSTSSITAAQNSIPEPPIYL